MTDKNNASDWALPVPDDNGANVPGADSTNAQDDLGVGASDINEAPGTQVYDMRDLGSESDSNVQPWGVFDENHGEYPPNYPGGYPGNGPSPSDTGAWGAPTRMNKWAERKSKGCLWTIVGALIVLVVLAVAALLYVLKIDKEVNGRGAEAAPKSTLTVTETASSSGPKSTLTVTETASTAEPKSTATELKNSNSASAAGGCSPSDFPSGSGEIAVVECDGQWALVGPPQTDGLSAMHWENGRWVRVEEDGERTFGLSGPCFTSDYMRQLGMPSSFDRRVGCGD